MRRELLMVALTLAGGGCGSSTDGRAADWEYISPVILQPSCATASCHSRAAAVAGLDFSDPDRGYISLTRLRYEIVDRYATGEGCSPEHETVVCRGAYRPLVTPYDPAQSRLVYLLRRNTPPRMPPDRPLLEADIRLIENWILLGAPRHAGGPDTAGFDTDGGVIDGGVIDGGVIDGAVIDGGVIDGASPDGPRDASDDGAPPLTVDNLDHRG